LISIASLIFGLKGFIWGTIGIVAWIFHSNK
jgi:hypothetical protein